MSRKLALIIGNTEYEDSGLAQLKAPEADIRALADLLQDPQVGEFDEVFTLFNRPFAEVHPAIADFFADKKPNDLLWLYFSGHGVLDEQGRLYLAVKNTRRNLLSGSAIASLFLKDEMDRCRSKQQILILDCCHSGAFAQGAKGAVGAQAITDATFEGRGRFVLTATDKTQAAWEGDRVIGGGENSLFTHFMIEGLKTGAADADGDGRITLDELYEYVYDRVVEATPNQKPRKIVYDQEGKFVIFKNPHPPEIKPAALPPELQQTIEDARPWVREGAVRELERLLNSRVPGLALAAHEALKHLAEGDDSLKVRAAAAAVLTAYAKAQRAKAEAQAKEEAVKKEEEEKAQQEAEEERLAQQKAEKERAQPRRSRKLPWWGWVAGGVIVLALLVGGYALLASIPTGVPPTAIRVLPTAIPVLPTATQTPSIGSTRTHEKDGMVEVFVPAGEFLMGSANSDGDASDGEKPQHTVYLDAYWIDQTEVTNAQFDRFVQATGYQTDAEKVGSGYVLDPTTEKWYDTSDANWQHPRGPGSNRSGLDNHPVVQVSWNDAQAYCNWVGAQLPTEAQWEKAARGDNGQRYPWGDNDVAGNLLNFADRNLDVSWADTNVNDGYQFTAPVGSYPEGASPYGALDMAGNVWEWVADWYDETYYQNSPTTKPTGPGNGEYRVLRGGSWDNKAVDVRAANRNWLTPDYRDDGDGFRCVRSSP